MDIFNSLIRDLEDSNMLVGGRPFFFVK